MEETVARLAESVMPAPPPSELRHRLLKRVAAVEELRHWRTCGAMKTPGL